MASWEDGPEYAPALRPDHFAEPTGPPLPAEPPAPPPGPPPPVERPVFDQPQAPVAPLETLIPPVEDARDPLIPFAVVSASLTDATSAWSATHWSPPAGPPLLTDAPPSPLGQLPPGPAVTAPVGAPVAMPPQSSPFPAPGTTDWFRPAPPPYVPATPARSGPSAIAEALTLGVVICLAVGGIVWPLAPIALLIAFGLASRVKAGRSLVLGLFTAAVSVLLVVGVVAALLSDGFFSDWWDLVARWSQVLCWVTLVAGWIAVWRALRNSTAPSGPAPSVWG